MGKPSNPAPAKASSSSSASEAANFRRPSPAQDKEEGREDSRRRGCGGRIGGDSQAAFYGSVGCIIFMVVNYLYVRLADPRPVRVGQSWSLGLFGALIGLLFASLYRVLVTDPGEVPTEAWGEYADQSANVVSERKKNGARRFCRHSRVYKPDRAHYCRTTDRTILRYDHYCVFVDSSIGHGNHKHFILFLLYVSLSAGFICLDTHFSGRVFDPATSREVPELLAALQLVQFVLSSAFSLSIAAFLAFHLYLILSGHTTLEYSEKAGRFAASSSAFYATPYRGGLYDNMRQVFGSDPLTWWLPVPPRGQGSGLSFPMQTQHPSVLPPGYAQARPGVCF